VLLGCAGVQAIGQFAPVLHLSASGSTFLVIGVKYSSLISQSSDVIISVSGNQQVVRIGRRTYNDPIPGRYMTDHALFNNKNSFWKGKAFAPPAASKGPSIKGEIAVRVQMGALLDGQKNITMIGVSTIKVLSDFYTLTHHTQNVIDRISNLDPRIGGDELHCCCYNQLQQCWLDWSGGHHVAIQDTTL
jgi:hypothetical protein